ncbi:50S ribosomal protein L13 [Candidatus Dependentiae bacterium]|nr:50S ribosomal protein L13 [Candidatus Dependentiae bacterium]
MNKVYFASKENVTPKWHLIDANGKVLGRLATEIADIIRGKDKPEFTRHADAGDYVVVINCEKIVLTGRKLEDKTYPFYSGWRSGLKEITAKQMLEKKPEMMIELAVKRMLPKNKLTSQTIKKLKVYAGEQHPHGAQLIGFKA